MKLNLHSKHKVSLKQLQGEKVLDPLLLHQVDQTKNAADEASPEKANAGSASHTTGILKTRQGGFRTGWDGTGGGEGGRL